MSIKLASIYNILITKFRKSCVTKITCCLVHSNMINDLIITIGLYVLLRLIFDKVIVQICSDVSMLHDKVIHWLNGVILKLDEELFNV